MTEQEGEIRTVWNEQQHTGNERKLVYKISRTVQLGVLRRVPRSKRKLQS